VTAARSRRAGFSLIEVIVAMSLIAVVTIMLATMAVAAGRRGHLVELSTKRNLALAQQAGRIEAMPFTDVSKLTSSTTQMLIGDFSFNRVLTVTKTGVQRYTIKIVIRPIAAEFKPDSITIDRARPASGTPLCTTC
jgi:prepilin-type N-terminal cleavage/methylation domain-containing protein